MVRENRGNVGFFCFFDVVFFLLTGKTTLPLKATSDVQIITRLGDVSSIASFLEASKVRKKTLY